MVLSLAICRTIVKMVMVLSGVGGGCKIKTCQQNGAGIQELVFASDSAGVTHQHTSKIAENTLGNYMGYLRK